MTDIRRPWANPEPAGESGWLWREFMRDLERDYRAHGAEAIARIRKNDPRHYLRLLSLASRVANTARKPFEDLCDEELANLIQAARAAFAEHADTTTPRSP